MPKRIPQRMCVACRTMRPKRELIRLVITAAGEIALDPSGKKPGRGAYVCRNRKCLEQSIRGHKLDKGLKSHVNDAVIASLAAEMEALPPDESEETETEA
ncbi:MAG: YlxR family protein [Clostridiaceae bacterium]|nr:YlxR family protein [Clostridiaceae bacterium]